MKTELMLLLLDVARFIDVDPGNWLVLCCCDIKHMMNAQNCVYMAVCFGIKIWIAILQIISIKELLS